MQENANTDFNSVKGQLSAAAVASMKYSTLYRPDTSYNYLPKVEIYGLSQPRSRRDIRAILN